MEVIENWLSFQLSMRGVYKVYNKTKGVMKNHRVLLQILTIGMLTSVFCGSTFAQDKKLVIRIAKLQIDQAQLERFTVALKAKSKLQSVLSREF